MTEFFFYKTKSKLFIGEVSNFKKILKSTLKRDFKNSEVRKRKEYN